MAIATVNAPFSEEPLQVRDLQPVDDFAILLRQLVRLTNSHERDCNDRPRCPTTMHLNSVVRGVKMPDRG